MLPAAGYDETQLLTMAASLERASEHPLGVAIVAAAEERRLQLSAPTEVDSPVGKGLTGLVDGRRVLIGSARYLEGEGVTIGEWTTRADDVRGKGATVVLVALDGVVSGAIGIADPIRETTPEALAGLRSEGIRVVMMTGDNAVTAQAVARRLGIDEVEADVLSERKSEVVSGSDPKAKWWPWQVMVSTMLQRWPQRMLALPWEPEPMSPWKVRGLPCSMAT